ncbi:hypothetical protein BDY21DRAFT_86864 [Lineolata rhizophorae]|uniref:Uncharacterized protein n=1 Tax=Lineolata rhizophorae TaxID=578093 RepID=A0A6A6PC09_9PEZI|nr:hypothetical protein BDY21DRAFT_86864 [Lineolata rhizophorae]
MAPIALRVGAHGAQDAHDGRFRRSSQRGRVRRRLLGPRGVSLVHITGVFAARKALSFLLAAAARPPPRGSPAASRPRLARPARGPRGRPPISPETLRRKVSNAARRARPKPPDACNGLAKPLRHAPPPIDAAPVVICKTTSIARPPNLTPPSLALPSIDGHAPRRRPI